MRRNAIGIALLIIVPSAAISWLWTRAGSAAAPTVPTGASFSLVLDTGQSPDVAALIVNTVQKANMPAFARVGRGGWHQVIVGPYVAIDEAERAQRQLGRRGFVASMLVDESVRRPARAESFTGGPVDAAGVHLVLVGGAGRYSLVLECPDEVALVAAPRLTGSLIEVEAGPLTRPVDTRVWNGPEQLDLVNQIAIEGFDRAGAPFLRARLALKDGVAAQSRRAGTRVYIDFWQTSMPERHGGHPSGVPARRAALAARESTVAAEMSLADYRAAVAPVADRLTVMKPFIASALTAPSPEVAQALDDSLTGMASWLKGIDPPAAAAGEHVALLAAIEDARRALSAATPRPPQSTPPQP